MSAPDKVTPGEQWRGRTASLCTGLRAERQEAGRDGGCTVASTLARLLGEAGQAGPLLAVLGSGSDGPSVGQGSGRHAYHADSDGLKQ